MTREQYKSLHLKDLREVAKQRGIKRTSTMRKPDLIDAMLALDAQEQEDRNKESSAEETKVETVRTSETQEKEQTETSDGQPERQKTAEPSEKRYKRRNYPENRRTAHRDNNARRENPRRGRVSNAHSNENGTAEVRSEYHEALEKNRNRNNRNRIVTHAEEPHREEENIQEPVKEPQNYEELSVREEMEEREDYPDRVNERGTASHDDLARGILEVMQDGYGFLRSDNFLSGDHDVYVSPSQIRRFRLRTGDLVVGSKRERGQGEKFGALLHVDTVNDLPADEIRGRAVFEKMTPIFPNRRIRLERPDGSRATRIVDLISPIGYGQRGMIVSPPKAGKTTLLKDIAKSILTLNPEQHLMILLIDERPEEVTDMRETVHGVNVDIVASTFDEQPEHHRRAAEMVIERAKRLVEQHEDVIILLDSITRLARACNVLVPQSGRTLSGGLDPTALYMPKKFFGAARNMREGGSLTILATALVDTGSKMDDVVYEEFKGTGNMELILDRKLQERRIFPAIDIVKSGTRRDDLLLTEKEEKAVTLMRRRLNSLKAEEAVEAVLNAFTHFSTNEMVVNAILSKWQ